MGKHDPAGLIRETSWPFYLGLDAYFMLWYWYTLERESLAAGMVLEGRVCVIDVGGISLGRAVGLVKSFAKQNASYPGGEAPLPDGAVQIWMVGLPWFVEKLWALVKRLMPPAEQAKIRMFAQKDARYLEQLSTRVPLDRVPPAFGGSSRERWPYGEGGDVAKGAIAALERAAKASSTRGGTAVIARGLGHPPSPLPSPLASPDLVGAFRASTTVLADRTSPPASGRLNEPVTV